FLCLRRLSCVRRLYSGLPIGIQNMLFGHDTFNPCHQIGMIYRDVWFLLWIGPEIVQFQRTLQCGPVALPVIGTHGLLEWIGALVDLPIKPIMLRRLLVSEKRGHD